MKGSTMSSTHSPLSARAKVAVAAMAIGACLLAFAPAASAGKPSGGSGGKPSGGSSAMTLVLVDSTDGLPHWGQHVRFNVTTTATAEPHVSLKCKQAGSLVYSSQTGYYDSYPWPDTQTFTLSSGSWTGGGADCVATMYYFSGSKTVTGATLSFSVYA